MNIDKKICWYQDDLYIQTLGVMGYNMTEVAHGKVLQSLLKIISGKTLIDLGCGNGMANVIIEQEYTGVDLPNNVETMCRPEFPNLKFIAADIIEQDIHFIKDYDIVLMNAFIDVMQYPLEVLEKVLYDSSKYVILHRQEIHEGETKITINPAYGGKTYHSIINRKEFMKILSRRNFTIIKEVDASFGGNWRSLILKRK